MLKNSFFFFHSEHNKLFQTKITKLKNKKIKFELKRKIFRFIFFKNYFKEISLLSFDKGLDSLEIAPIRSTKKKTQEFLFSIYLLP